MISTVDLTRKGLLRVIGYLEVTDLPTSERFNAAINDLVKWVEDHPEDLDRFFADTPAPLHTWEAATPETNGAKVRQAYAARYGSSLRSVDLADYDHAGFNTELTYRASLPESQYGMINPS